MRSKGYQAKMACGNLHTYSGLEDGIEGATHAVGEGRKERTKKRGVEEAVE